MAAGGGGGAGWGRQKLDRLGSLEMRRESKRRGLLLPGAAKPPSLLLSKEDPVLLETPGLPPRRARLPAGPGELTYFGAEAALGRAEGGERGGEREQGEQQTAGGPWGRRHGPRPSRQPAVQAPRRGPQALGSRRHSLGSPLSSVGTEFGFLERCPLGDGGIVLQSVCLFVPSFPFFDLSSA